MNEKCSIIKYGCFHPDHLEEMRYFEECKVYTVQIDRLSPVFRDASIVMHPRP